MRILIFGASGQTGRELVTQAMQRGHAVTAFARQPDKLAVAARNLRVVQGNVVNKDEVGAAIPGHDAIVSCLGVGVPFKPDPDVVNGVGHIVSEAQRHNVRRLIYQSFIGVRESRAAVGFVLRFIAPIPLRHEIADHEAKEALVKASSLDWTIVRPPKLTNGPRAATYRVGETISTIFPVSTLSRADVAHFILDELAERKFVRQAPRLLP